MFRKYEKTYRIKVPQFEVPGKFTLSDADTKRLLVGQVVIEEKLDGANIGIIRTKSSPFFRLQKRGSLVGPSEHAQFNFFVNWSYQNVAPVVDHIPKGYILYGELLYAKHNVVYDSLTSFVQIFDVWDGQEYLDRKESEECFEVGLKMVPLVYSGPAPRREDLVGMIPKRSAMSTIESPEGIVVKNFKKQLRGKIVCPQFVEKIDEEEEYWARKAVEKNRLLAT